MDMDFIDQEIAIGLAKHEARFHKIIVEELPAIVYVNRIERPGDITSIHNMFMNQRGLDFLGTTSSELCSRRIDFFMEIIHPSDLELMAVSLKTVYPAGSSQFFVPMLRVKPKGRADYSLFCCSKVVMDTFADGTLKMVMVTAMQITPPDHLLPSGLPEKNRLECDIKLSKLTNRETEVLGLIVKGVTTKKMAGKLCISYSTAKTHRHNIYQKTGAKNSAELTALAVESGTF
ncbi:MAG: LuxR C-terminal-related transcriptional regulator [Bacteroidia bacterium]|nr:LuxR C-terminal-related transcriptional regulator [Bacteroidia bacterium]